MIGSHHIFGLFSAVTSAFAFVLAKRAYKEGATPTQLSVASNVLIPLIYIPLIFFTDININWSEVFWPILTGAGIFTGMMLSYLALKMGDISIQSPILSGKVVTVALASIILGLEDISISVIIGVVLTMVGIVFISRDKKVESKDSKEKKQLLKDIIKPILVAFMAISFMAIPDLTIQEKSADFSKIPFIILGFSVCSVLLIIYSIITGNKLSKAPKSSRKWILYSGALATVASAAVGYSASFFGKVNEFNIVQGTRGLWSILIIVLLSKKLGLSESNIDKSVMKNRFIGAGFMLAAMIIMLYYGN